MNSIVSTQSVAGSPRLTTGEALVKTLEDRGLTHVFGIPGIHTIELYRGLAGSRLEHVLTRHEQGAGFMADGFARATGRPAACFFITGPGVTNAMTAIGQAYSDSVPMLIFASSATVGDIGRQRGRLHESKNQRAMLEPITAFAVTAHRPEDVPEYIDRAFAVFESRRPRPVYIDIPLDVLAQPASGSWAPRRMSTRPGPRPQDVNRAAELLSAARRPAIICGGGARHAAEDIVGLAEHLAIPVFSTIAGKGILPGTHPLSLDAILHREDGRAFLSECDVVLAVGTELAESELLTPDPLPIGGELIRIDIDHEVLCDEQAISLPMLADAKLALGAIRGQVRIACPRRDRTAAEAGVKRLRDGIRSGQEGLDEVYARALETISQALPAETLIFTDMTTIAYAGNFLFPATAEGRWFHPAGFGSLGYGVPAAIGATIADPERPVVALVGDGGFQFTMPEMAVVAENRLPLTTIIWNNECFGQIKKGMLARGVEPVGVDYASPDFKQIAAAYGIATATPETREEALGAIRDAVARRRPVIIELTPATFSAAPNGAARR